MQQEPTGQPQHHPGQAYGYQQYPPPPDPRGPWQGHQAPAYPPHPYGDYQQYPPQHQPPPQQHYPVPHPQPHPLVAYQSAYPAPFQPPGYVLPGQPVVYPGQYNPYAQPVQHVIVFTAGQPPQVYTAEPVSAERPAPAPAAAPAAPGTQELPRPEPKAAEAAPEPKAVEGGGTETVGTKEPAAKEPAAQEPASGKQANPAPEPAAAAVPGPPDPRVAPGKSGGLLNEALAGLAMRDLSLVDALLEMVEELETDAQDPDLLDKLFQIDNFATRMRRNGENFLVLTGHDGGESDAHDEIVPLLDVARAATSEIKDYPRVRLGKLPQTSVTGMAADDISHLLAELLDNATANSPEHSQVVISAREMDDGRLMVVVEDEGVGMPEAQLSELNERLAGSPNLDEEVSRHMGLYVASRIANKHGLKARLESRSFRGVSAYVIIPNDLLRVATPRTPGRPRTSAVPTIGASTTTPVSAPTPGSNGARGASGVNGTPISKQGPGGTGNGIDGGSGNGSGGGDSNVTSAGLPRRSATPHGSPLRMMPTPDPRAKAAPPVDDVPRLTGDARAEQIRDELGDFFDGERAAREDTDDGEGT